MRIACKRCKNDSNCRYHMSNDYYRGKLNTKVSKSFSKFFKVYDPEDEKIKKVKLRKSERENSDLIEITRNTATCSRCSQFINCKVFTNFRKNNSINFVICDTCFNDENITFDKIKKMLFPGVESYGNYR